MEHSLNKGTQNNLPLGAAREPCLLKTTVTPDRQTVNQIVIDMTKLGDLDESITDDHLAGLFQTNKEDMSGETVNGNKVLIIPYGDASHLEEVLKTNPNIRAAAYNKQQGQKPPNGNQPTWVKIRHCPVKVDMTRVMLLNNLSNWYGSIYPHRDGRSHTTASLKAPNERDAQKLLEKGYIVANGKLLAAVPNTSTHKEEEARTVLLVGVNKIQDYMVINNNKVTEIGLLLSLKWKGYPVQSLKLVYLDGDRIGHSAYVLLRTSMPASTLLPLKDSASETTLKWTEVTDHDKICGKCLAWPGHAPACSKHSDNAHRYISTQQIAKRAAEGGSLILESFKKLKPPSE